MADTEITTVEFMDQLVSRIIDDLIVGGAANVAAEAERLLTPMVTLYVVVWGYRLMAGRESTRGLAWEMARLSAILLLVVNFETYNQYVKEPLVSLPEYMASVVIGGDPNEGIVGQLDRTLKSGFSVGAYYWGEASLLRGEFGLFFFALLIWVSVAIPIAMAAFLVVLSKLYVGVLLVLGPIVIALTLFERTRGYFERWINEVVTRSMVVMFAVLVPKIMTYYFEKNLDTINQYHHSGDGIFASAFVIIFFSISQVLFYWQIPVIASAIASGFQLAPHGIDRRIHQGVLGAPAAFKRMEKNIDGYLEQRWRDKQDEQLNYARGIETRSRPFFWPWR